MLIFYMLNQLYVGIFNLINQFAGRNIILDYTGIILATYLPFVFILTLLYLWFRNMGYKKIVLYSAYSAILGILLNFLITLFYFHPRPFMEHIGTLLINHVSDSSFPSEIGRASCRERV